MEWEEDWRADESPEGDRPRPVPWEDPELSGPVGFYRTLRDLLLHPGQVFDHLGDNGWAEPLAFALIVSTAGLLGALFWHLLLLAPLGLSPGGDADGLELGAEMLLVLMAGIPVLVLMDLIVGSLCWWASVALAGAGREFLPAWRVYCYAHAGLALGLIPFLGSLLAGIWVLALMYFGARQSYGLSAWGSLGALLVFLTLQAFLGLILLVSLTAALTLLGFLSLLA